MASLLSGYEARGTLTLFAGEHFDLVGKWTELTEEEARDKFDDAVERGEADCASFFIPSAHPSPVFWSKKHGTAEARRRSFGIRQAIEIESFGTKEVAGDMSREHVYCFSKAEARLFSLIGRKKDELCR